MAALAERLRLNPNHPVFGLSYQWCALCIGNDYGAIFWLQLPFVYFELNRDFIELGLGRGKHLLSLTARWRWE